MSAFYLGVLSSIIASFVFAFSSWIYATKYKKELIIFLGKLSGTGIEYIYKSDSDANSDMLTAIKRSASVKVFSMRAFRMLKDGAGLKILLQEDCPCGSVDVLLADYDSLSVKKRAEEFLKIDPTYTIERYKEDIRWSVKQVCSNQRNPNLKLRLHSQPAFIRMLITDDYLFLSFFSKIETGDNSKVFKITRFSPLYEALYRYFDWIWVQSSIDYPQH